MKSRHEKILVSRHNTIKDTLKIINMGAIGIALVTDKQKRLLGTVTDGDIRRGLLRGISLSEPVEKIMNSKPIVSSPKESKLKLLEIMKKKIIKQIPIVNSENKIVDIKIMDDLIEIDKESIRTAVILAGGLGKRLMPLTEDTPKPLLQVGGKPILELLIEQLSFYGFKDLYISVCYKSKKIKEYFVDGRKHGVNIKYIEEKELTGTVGPLRLLCSKIQKPFVVTNGDLLTRIHFANFLNFHEKYRFDMTIGIKDYKVKIPYGVIKTKGINTIAIEEKPTQEFFVNAGVYILNPEILEYIPEKGKFDMTDLIRKLFKEHKKVGSFPIHEYWLDIGREEDYIKANGIYKEFFKE